MELKRKARGLCAVLVAAALLQPVCFAGRDPGPYSNAVDWDSATKKLGIAVAIVGGVAVLYLVSLFVHRSGGKDDGSQLSAEPGKMNFGSVAVGSVATGDLIYTNKGRSPLDVSAVLTPADSCFALSEPSQTHLSIPAGGQTKVSVVFKPSSPGKCSGVLEARASTGGKPRKVALAGVGNAAR